MNKDLEALVKYIRLEKEFIGNDTYRLYIKKNGMEDLEKALQRLESIDNAKPSEALEILEGIEYVADVLKVNHKIGSRDIANQEIKEMVDRLNYRIPIIKQALLKAQEQEKVLSIIKEKNVNIELLKYRLRDKDDDVYLHYKYDFIMTREEFDLLKRWLG